MNAGLAPRSRGRYSTPERERGARSVSQVWTFFETVKKSLRFWRQKFPSCKRYSEAILMYIIYALGGHLNQKFISQDFQGYINGEIEMFTASSSSFNTISTNNDRSKTSSKDTTNTNLIANISEKVIGGFLATGIFFI